MTKKCELTGVLPLKGHNVSHANNKTKRRFYPNLHNVSFFSEILGKKIKLKVSSRGIKTVEKNGGIDSFLMNAFSKNLSSDARKYKKSISKATVQNNSKKD